ncbi:MAG: hypothetical protein K0Q55_2160 [Verrucomicrobia bacterium]|jgi:hypothetical protein|nr:hypothetical protein [Verrucomicrobiota bacterium]
MRWTLFSFLFLSFIAVSCNKAVKPSDEAKTLATIRQIYNVLDWPEQEKIRTEWLRTNDFPNEKLCLILSEWSHFPQKEIAELTMSTPPRKDAWGREIKIAWKSGVNGQKNSRSSDLLIWSLGPDGVDNACSGDDIFLKR